MRKIINDYPNYSISSDGTVTNVVSGRTLRPSKASGYYRICLINNNGEKYMSIHRLVACAFIENINNKKEVNHIDGNKLNNNINNLEWNTSSENRLHAYRTGLQSSSKKHKDAVRKSCRFIGLNNRKIDLDTASEICEAFATKMFRNKDIAEYFGVHQSTISKLTRS